jgi:PleD family two-component response regulator
VGQRTVSFGIATYHDGDDEKSMVSRADKALYLAKENGRNRVEIEE